MAKWGKIKCPRCAEAYQAQLVAEAKLERVVAAEWRDAIALVTGIVDDCLLVDAQGKIIDFEYTDFQMRIAAIPEGGK
jgi:hypothetical protein